MRPFSRRLADSLTRRFADSLTRSPSALRTALLVLLAVAVVAGSAMLLRGEWALLGSQRHLRQWVASFGPWGPLVSIALNVAQVLLAPIPGQFVGLMNGYLYGLWPGVLYSLAGLTLGTALAMALAHFFGRPLVERLVRPETLARWDRLADRRGPAFFFLVFLLPFVPDDVACFLIGLSPLSIGRMLILATIGRLPGVFTSCWIGAYATDLPWWAWIPLSGGAAGLAWAFWRYQPHLEAAAVRLIERLTGPRRSQAAPEHCAAQETRSTSP